MQSENYVYRPTEWLAHMVWETWMRSMRSLVRLITNRGCNAFNKDGSLIGRRPGTWNADRDAWVNQPLRHLTAEGSLAGRYAEVPSRRDLLSSRPF